MGDLDIAFLKVLTAKPFQRDPRPKVTIAKLLTALQRMGSPDATFEEVVASLQRTKGRGLSNTSPKILLPDELKEVSFQIWITPLGRDTLHSALSS